MSSKEDILKWLHDNLSSILSFPVPSDLTEYLMTIENDRDIEDFMRTLLDLSEPRHRQFVENFKIIRHCGNLQKGYKKTDSNVTEVNDADKRKKKIYIDKENKNPPQLEHLKIQNDAQKKETSHKKKSKFVNLFSPEGEGKDIIFLKGRHHCDCQASKHKLINNCLKCGRVVCAQEGSGPCFFCNTMVCSKEEQDFINANTKQSRKLYDNLMESGKPQGWEKAMEARDRLLEYDKTSERRTKVIDDEGEYFSSSSVWLSPAERERMKKKEEEAAAKKHASRFDRKVTLDFAGRRIVEEMDSTDFDEDFYREAMEKMEESLAGSNAHPGLSPSMQPLYVNKIHSSYQELKKPIKNDGNVIIRVQDKEFLEMADTGVCLSMHQPWASLLVAGIKRHEGRTWYSSHRGRLWIAATAKQPMEQEVVEMEEYYSLLRPGENIEFPTSYPTSCLLGCVTVIDCLPQEEYRSRYPEGESDSPFVFICEDHKQLDLRFPISGQHKIYKLDSKIHQAAKKTLLRLAREGNL